MAVATISQILTDVKQVLPIYDTLAFDGELQIYVNAAMSKLESEGVTNSFNYGTPAYYDYLTCVRYQVAQDMDLDIDIDRLKAQYVTRVNTLRCTLKQKLN